MSTMIPKVGYLTIDDGPTTDFKRKVKFLREKKYPAIFFCRGDRMEERKEVVIDAIQKGFIIGNHSYDHPHFSQISLRDGFQQIRRTDEIIEELYKEAGVSRPAKLFRFPYGDKGSGMDAELGWPEDKDKVLFMQGIQNYLKKLGYHQPLFENISYKWYKEAKLHLDYDIYWTYYTHDCSVAEYRESGKENKGGYHNLKALLERMNEDVPEGCRGLNYSKSNDIILLHDYEGIEDLFQPLIEALAKRGLYFKYPIFNF